MRRIVRRLGALLLPAALLSGCGATYKLPTETQKNRTIPSDKSYQMLATWTGMDGIADVLLTQGIGTQLFLLFNHGGSGLASRGEVRAYPLSRPTAIAGIDFPTLFNPVAMCSGAGKLFVLDQGDTCLARANPATGNCGIADGWNARVSNLALYWRVREYGLLGGDTLETFTDTTMAYVRGIAADASGNIYVSGSAVILIPDSSDPRILTRSFQYRVYKYVKGPRYPGVIPADRRMPGANWHRDTTYTVEEGSGIGTLVDPRGLFWNAYGGDALYAADFGKNWIQKLSDSQSNTGFYQLDIAAGQNLSEPTDVTVDLAGFVYVCDTGNARVLRFDPGAGYVQQVNVEADAQGQVLQIPVAVAADDSLAYVADAGLGKVIRYKRRP
jgi:NHL repeat